MLISRIKGVIQSYNTAKKNLLLGYAQCRIITDNNESAINCSFIEVNKDFELLTGLKERKIIGKSVNEIMPGLLDNIQKYTGIFNSLNKETDIRFEYYSEKSDKWFLISIYNKNRNCFSAIFQDITDTKKELELTEIDKKYKVFFSSMADAAFLVDHNSGRILEANHAATRMYDYNYEELHGMMYVKISAEQEQTMEALESVSSFIPLSYHKKKDGTIFPIEATVNSFMLNGQKMIIITVRDVSERVKAENKLWDLTNEYMKVYNSTQDAMFMIDVEKDGKFRYKTVNTVNCNAVGLSTEEIIGKTPKEIFGEKAGEELEVHYRRCIADKAPVSFESTLLTPNWKSSDTILSPVIENDQVIHIVGSARDITDRKNTEEALRKSESKYRQMVENAQEGIWAIDQESRTTFVNSRMAEMLGYSVEELIEKSVFSVMPKKAIEKYLYGINDLKQVEKILTEDICARKDGSPLYVSLAISPIIDDNGALIGGLTLVNDITDRKLAEMSLIEKESKFRDIVENAFEIIFLFDSDGRCTYASPHWNDILGYETTEVEGQSIYSFIHPDYLLHCILQFEEIHKTSGKASNIEYKIKHKDGSWHWLSLNVSAIKHNNNKDLHYLGVARDITERKQKDEEIQYLNLHDQLTGLYNRTYLENEIARLDIDHLMPISVIAGDINSLKLINDVFGYQEGDKLLVRVARIMENACRKEDIITRWDGDEFMIVLPQTEEKEAIRICERINNACLSADNSLVQPSITLGIAVSQDSSHDLMKVIKQAEEWMLQNKLLENKSNYSSILTVLENTLFERKCETEEHTKRLCRISTQIGNKIGLPINKIKELELLCLLHDIGKIAIPDSILLKPDKLDKVEWEVMKKHPEIGYRIVKPSHELANMSGYILSHHECWNGKGYPQGLKGDEIPELSRIISIVDAYDVMTHRRVYKEAISHQEAVFEIQKCAGTQFDPDIVSIFANVINESKTA